MTKPRCLPFALVALVSIFCMGCGSSGRLSVDGSASFDGEPIEYGHVQFVPVEGTQGPTGGSEIRDGSYKIDESRGLVKGTYRVEVQAWKRDGKLTEDLVTGEMTQGGDLKAFLPEEFNEQSKLTVTIEAGQQTHDFHLKSED